MWASVMRDCDVHQRTGTAPQHIRVPRGIRNTVAIVVDGKNTRVVDVHISRLRSKLEEDSSNPDLILTARGIGYMFQKIN